MIASYEGAKKLIKCFALSPTVPVSVQYKVNDEMTGAIVVWRQLLMSPVFVMRGG